jgi:hypothetical protein
MATSARRVKKVVKKTAQTRSGKAVSRIKAAASKAGTALKKAGAKTATAARKAGAKTASAAKKASKNKKVQVAAAVVAVTGAAVAAGMVARKKK